MDFKYKLIDIVSFNKVVGKLTYMKSNAQTIKYFNSLIGDKGFFYEGAFKEVKFRVFNSVSLEQVNKLFPIFTVDIDSSTLYDYNCKSYTYQIIAQKN